MVQPPGGRFPWAGEIADSREPAGGRRGDQGVAGVPAGAPGQEPRQALVLLCGLRQAAFPVHRAGRYFRRAIGRSRRRCRPGRPGYPDKLHPHDKYIVDDFHIYDFPDEIQARTVAAYYACVHYMDDCIAELLEGLQRAGMLDNTYVIYTSDHGEMCGEHGMWSKRSYYDGSAGAPLIVTGPGIPQGRVVKSPVELLDLFPTFCELAGLPMPDGLDGETLLPILQGQRDARTEAIREVGTANAERACFVPNGSRRALEVRGVPRVPAAAVRHAQRPRRNHRPAGVRLVLRPGSARRPESFRYRRPELGRDRRHPRRRGEAPPEGSRTGRTSRRCSISSTTAAS